MRVLTLVITLFLLSACSSTGVVPMGENIYSISKTSPACGFRDAGGVKSAIYIEMNKYCKSLKLYPEIISIEALDGVIGIRCASATRKGDTTKPSNEKPNRDMNRNPLTPSDRGQFGNKNPGTIKIQKNINMQKPEDMFSDLKRLKELLDSGAITKDEFHKLKAKIMRKF